MSELRLSPVIMEGFSIKLNLESSVLKVVLRGSADMEARPSLSQFVPLAHAEAERLSVDEVVIDVHEARFHQFGVPKIAGRLD